MHNKKYSWIKRALGLQKKHLKNLEILELDLLGENSENTLSEQLSDKPIDIFINNAGVGNSDQRFGVVSSQPWVGVLKVNLIAPLTVTQSIIENIKKGSDKKIYFLSSQLGSIEDNTSGGMYIYRSSKIALNQVVKFFISRFKTDGYNSYITTSRMGEIRYGRNQCSSFN